MFGRGVDHHICAKLQRMLRHRRCEDIVNHHYSTGGMRHLADGANINNIQHWIGRGFEKYHLCRCCKRPFPSTKIRAIDKFGYDTPTRQNILQNGITGAKQRTARHHPVTCIQLRG